MSTNNKRKVQTIRSLRILPPFAIARLGSADAPMDNYTIEMGVKLDEDKPLGYRTLKPLPTLIVDEQTGAIKDEAPTPKLLEFIHDGKIRPVAPFLEVFAVLDNGEFAPLTLDLLKRNDLIEETADETHIISWRVWLANRKVARRTGDPKDVVATKEDIVIRDHDAHILRGFCENFRSPKVDHIDFGRARFIRPTAAHPEIRLRFTPAKGLIYGPPADPEKHGKQFHVHSKQAIYGDQGIWVGYPDPPHLSPEEKGRWKNKRDAIWKRNGWPEEFDNETLPPSLFAINPPAPSWLFDNVAISRGYLDDASDGFIEVTLALPNDVTFKATARICSAPPAMVPDSLFVRSLADDLDQAIFGPDVAYEGPEKTLARAQDIVRRAYETVRFMNVAVTNGNDFKGRSALSLDSMPEEEAAVTERAIRPVMHPGSVDTRAITALHQQAYAALRAGTAPWFAHLLRRPDDAADYTDHGRRKMPALMCGSDNNYLALTWRQIHTIEKAASDPHLIDARTNPDARNGLIPRNLAARHAAIHYEAKGNPVSSRPITSVGNCCPGLEVDFRAVWRRLFKGVELREYDNLVVRLDAEFEDDNTLAEFVGRRLLRIRAAGEDGAFIRTTAPIKGPASSDPDGRITLTTNMNPSGLAPLEWSNVLAYVVPLAGQKVWCDFSKEEAWDRQVKLTEEDSEKETEKNYKSVELEVQPFFEDETAVINRALVKAGELTQGLCSPWQNDYRECSCYYWASARPDFVNVETGPDGLSAGDNWFQKARTGSYVPDDYADSRLVLYDELFIEWETALKFQVGGRDYPPPPRDREAGGKR
ncbi:MAG TPA: hypothetical protein VFE60_09840 [Roseiarcus sp.]|jgi:hypothetical protein|nr:hypothetical protein [Roseiarcus sp.]